MKTIDDYAKQFRTDKASWGHNFTEFYSDLFDGLRSKPVTILEFGIKFGSSICMWEEAFPLAKVVGVDKNLPKMRLKPKRASLVSADLSSREEIASICKQHGPFDIVIEDSAHTAEVTRNVVETLWPQWIKPGGWLVIEDINSGYKDIPAEHQRDDQISYCESLVRAVCHHGKLTRCGPNYWSGSSEFDKAIKQIIYRPGIMAMERR